MKWRRCLPLMRTNRRRDNQQRRLYQTRKRRLTKRSHSRLVMKTIGLKPLKNQLITNQYLNRISKIRNLNRISKISNLIRLSQWTIWGRASSYKKVPDLPLASPTRMRSRLTMTRDQAWWFKSVSVKSFKIAGCRRIWSGKLKSNVLISLLLFRCAGTWKFTRNA